MLCTGALQWDFVERKHAGNRKGGAPGDTNGPETPFQYWGLGGLNEIVLQGSESEAAVLGFSHG